MKRGWNTASAVQEEAALGGARLQACLVRSSLPDCHHERASTREGSVLCSHDQRRAVGQGAAGSMILNAKLEHHSGVRGEQIPRSARDDNRRRNGLTCTPKGVLHPFLIALVILFNTFALAQSITGTVTNGTTSKPAVGDDVTLIALSQGMQEIGSTKTDAQGKFSFPAPSDRAPHMVRVTHGSVNYFPQGGPLMPGATTTEVTVFDTAKKVEPLNQTVEVDRYQSDGKQLQGIALFAIQNASNPPRTMDADKTFEFELPAGAQLDSSDAKGPGGQPIQAPATETGQRNTYAFNFPLKPGETQFQVSYHMPYSGEASFAPKPLADVQHFVVMLPKGMSFSPKNAQQFQNMPDKSGSTIMVATNVKPGQDLSFRIAGSGVFPQEGPEDAGAGDGGGGGAMGGGQAAANDNRPGGGLGAPIDAPDPLHNYRAVILGAFALVLVMGGFYIVTRSNHRAHPATAAGPRIDAPVTGDRSTILLEAMKEELFQLEVERQQGKLSEEEYAKAKAALDETMRRALARKST